MADPWLSILESLPLSRAEKDLVERYRRDPEGRVFLPIADILRAYELYDESLELLTQGVGKHPDFTVARVVLARELYNKGLVAEAWSALRNSPSSLKDNVLAQKLLYRLAILLRMPTDARSIIQHLHQAGMLDPETKSMGDTMDASGFDAVRDRLIGTLKERGTDPVIPELLPDPSTQIPLPTAIQKSSSAYGSNWDSKNERIPERYKEDDPALQFHVVPLEEILRGGEVPTTGHGRRAAAAGVELDSITLADIYSKQGLYSKALAVYRRLLKMSPHNDMLKKKVSEIAKLDRTQRDQDLIVDPTLVDKMETLEIIDRQISFYNDLWEKLK